MDSIDEEDEDDDGAELLLCDDEEDGAIVDDRLDDTLERALLALEAVGAAVSLPQAPSRASPAAAAATMVARLENAVVENMVEPFFVSGHAVADPVAGTGGWSGNCGWCGTALPVRNGCYSTVKTVES